VNQDTRFEVTKKLAALIAQTALYFQLSDPGFHFRETVKPAELYWQAFSWLLIFGCTVISMSGILIPAYFLSFFKSSRSDPSLFTYSVNSDEYLTESSRFFGKSILKWCLTVAGPESRIYISVDKKTASLSE
jgi:hypothetical protein